MPKRYLIYLLFIAIAVIGSLIFFPPRALSPLSTSPFVIRPLANLFKYEAAHDEKKPPDITSYFDNKGSGSTISFTSFSYLLDHTKEKLRSAILGTQDEVSPTATISGTFTIAFLGDSMIDVLGPEVSIFKIEIGKVYPKARFIVHNGGAASTDMEWGLTRLTNEYSYLGTKRPSILSTNPDILVVESFAYNHWGGDTGDLNRQWLTIASIIDTVKRASPKTKIVLAATIAPNCATYTDGSAKLPPERKFKECEIVKKYLQNMVNFATSQHYPLVDVYHLTLDDKGEGIPKYIAGDNIHPSGQGGELFAKKAVEIIVNNKLLD